MPQNTDSALKITELQKLCIIGLTTDGDHHKQYYLEEILKIAFSISDEKKADENFAEAFSLFHWEKGIPN